jgi:DNA-binding NarL/FixJ family response regulator
VELVKQLRAVRPEMPVLVLSMYAEEIHADRAIQSGANGYLMKDTQPATVISALREILAGKFYLSAQTRARIRPQRDQNQTCGFRFPINSFDQLEIRVLTLLGRGYVKQEIAERLELGEQVVANCFNQLKQKLHLRYVQDLVHFAVQRVRSGGLIASDNSSCIGLDSTSMHRTTQSS